KAGDALRANLANVLLNRQLTELIRDVPLDSGPADLAVRPWDREAVHRLFDELEFRVLRERLFATLQSAEPEAEGGIEVQGAALAAYLSRPGQRSFDLADLALRHLRRELRVDGETGDGQLSLLGGDLSEDGPSGEDEADAARANANMVAASAVAELADVLDAE